MRKLVVLVLLAVLLSLSACGGGNADDEPSAQETPIVPSSGQESSEATPSSPTQEAEEPTVDSSEQDLSLSSVTGGLESLDSYKSRFTVSFVGTDAQGQSINSYWTMEEDFVREPRAQRTAMTSTDSSAGQSGQPETVEIYTVGDVMYWVTQDTDGTSSCTSMSSSEPSSLQQGSFTPDMMGGVSDAKYVGKETVNGVQTKHYAWQDSTLPLFGFGSVKGDVWTATDGEYVVKYRAEASGNGSLLGRAEGEGTITVEYDLTDVNGSFTIEAPADCEGPASDIPIMADAEDKSTFGATITYSSPSALADVQAFYQAEMPNNGWQASGEPAVMEGFATLEYTKEGRTAQIMISYDGETQKSSILVNISSEE